MGFAARAGSNPVSDTTSVPLPRQHRDVVVVGLGVVGSSTALALAARGHDVLGIDRFGSGHPLTSSTGASRTFRVAYDDVRYVRLALEAIDRWRALERDRGVELLHATGQVDLGPVDRLEALAAAMAAAHVPIEELTGSGVAERFPELHAGRAEPALFHAEAGTVLADRAMRALADAALGRGAEIAAPERVSALEPGPDGVEVRTEARIVTAERVVIAAGPWSEPLLRTAGLSVPLAPALGQVTFLEAPALVGRPALVEWPDGSSPGVYGHPVPGVGYKIAFDAGSDDAWDPEAEAWVADPDEEAGLLRWAAARLPAVEPVVALTQRHPWTMTPDGDFVVDRRGRVTVAVGCSGHAFKFGPALGELVADVADDVARSDRPLFALDRPGLREAAVGSIPIPR